MPPRALVVLLAAGLLAPAARAAPAAEVAATRAVELPLEWFTGPVRPSHELWHAEAMGRTTYSYLRSRRSASLLGALPARAIGPVAGGEPAGAEQTYTVVEQVGRDRARQPLANAAFLFASAACGIGGIAWWRCSSRDPS